MVARSKVYSLPDEVKLELDKKLIENHFSKYDDLETWLDEQGFQISSSSLQRYGYKFQKQLDGIRIATEQARAIAEIVPDDENRMSEALVRVAQQKLYDVLLDIEPIPEEMELPKLVSAIAKLNQSSVNLKKYQTEVKTKANLTAEEVEKVAKKQGMQDTDVDWLKRKILEIAG